MQRRYFQWTILATIACGALYASPLKENFIQTSWDPEYSLTDDEILRLDSLKNPDFKELKNRVLDHLKNSWCSAEKANLLMELVLLTQPRICVEIGAFTGSSLLPIAATLKYLKHGKVFAIDAWSNSEATKNLEVDDPNKPWWSTVNMNVVYGAFKDMLDNWGLKSYCTVLYTSSENAVHHVNNIDFLHLDGDYSEKGSLQDVQLYLPKVKSGGYILLSNLFTMVKDKQPKLKAFRALFNECEIISEIEHNNVVLFRKR